MWHFNPRLREGGDGKQFGYLRKSSNFNPRLREGGDAEIADPKDVMPISIHASAREATQSHAPLFFLFANFNPRLREGGDVRNIQQSAIRGDFNPRLREGGDPDTECIAQHFLISIHASAREATKSPSMPLTEA